MKYCSLSKKLRTIWLFVTIFLSSFWGSNSKWMYHGLQKRKEWRLLILTCWLHDPPPPFVTYQTHFLIFFSSTEKMLKLFLHSCMYNTDATKSTILAYYNLRIESPYYFSERDPSAKCFNVLIEKGYRYKSNSGKAKWVLWAVQTPLFQSQNKFQANFGK